MNHNLARSDWDYKLLAPLAWLYGRAVTLRNLAYDHRWFRQVRVPAFVISIGNLTVGGTGKTPMVAYLANRLIARRVKVAIVARGYRRQSRAACIVSDGQSVLAGIDEAGDEPLMLADECHGAAIVVDRQKSHAAEIACQRFDPDVVVVDDGFQHRRLARDLDIVLMPESLLQQPSRLLPAGPLRESLRSLQRADIVLVSGAVTSPDAPPELMRARCRELPHAHFWQVTYEAASLRSLEGDREQSLEVLRQQPVMLVSGIAAPERFQASVHAGGAIVREHASFADHHCYSARELQEVVTRFHQSGAVMLVTTAKDAVKLRQFNFLSRLPCFVLQLRAVVPDDFEAMVFSCLQPARPPRAI